MDELLKNLEDNKEIISNASRELNRLYHENINLKMLLYRMYVIHGGKMHSEPLDENTCEWIANSNVTMGTDNFLRFTLDK